MYLPPPGKIAIIGAGPIGLEAALYARYLGYAVEIFEQGRAAESVRRRDEEKMATPFVLNASPLALAALAAQDEAFRPPQADEFLTGGQWIERYLAPLAQSDLVVDGLHEQTTVVRIERLPAAAASTEIAAEDIDEDAPPPPSFRLQLRNAAGEESTAQANVILDCSGRGEGGAATFDGLLSVQRLDPTTSGPAALVTSEPNYYLLGGKAGGPDFTFADGLGQIRDLFTRIGDRAGLDLYSSMSANRS